MYKLIIRIIFSLAVAVLLALIGVKGNSVVLQTLFTVLGIVFSISMSLLVSFNLSKILNRDIRNGLRQSVIHTRNMLLCDFGTSTLFLFTALIWSQDKLRYDLAEWCIVDIMLIAVVFVAVSLLYEIYNFRKLHELHCSIEDAVINEEISKEQK